VLIRPATAADAPAIARVQSLTWQSAYRGIVPDAVLDGMDTAERIQQRAERWLENLSSGANIVHVAVEATAAVVGFAAAGRCRDADLPQYDGELFALYLLPAYQGGGTGRALVQHSAAALRAAGYRALLVWVLQDNHPARGFYERLGGQPVSQKSITIGVDLVEVSYGWPDLARAFEAAS
jgi:GNAT superfamily N-acetyltransferase